MRSCKPFSSAASSAGSNPVMVARGKSSAQALNEAPTQYSATFVSYADPEKMIMDTGFAEHSGCPVVEGEKKILTQYIQTFNQTVCMHH